MDADRVPFIPKILEHVNSNLSAAEKRISSQLLSNPHDFVQSSIQDVAKNAQTSTSTVSRFVRKVGFENLQHLKLSLSTDLAAMSSYLPHEVGPADSIQSIIDKVSKYNIASITDTVRLLRPRDIQQASEYMAAAQTILIIGSGGSSAAASDFHHKLFRTGVPVTVASDSHKQAMSAALLTPADVLIAISHEGKSFNILHAAQVARDQGCKVISISQRAFSPLCEISDISLFTVSEESEFRPEALSSRIATQTLTDILYAALATHSPKRLKENMKKIRHSMESVKSSQQP